MRKLLAALALCAALASAAGTVTQTMRPLGPGGSDPDPLAQSVVVAFNWTGDASTGSVPATAAINMGPLAGYLPIGIEVRPGTPAPTASYSLTITDMSGFDVMDGLAVSLSATAPQAFAASPNAPPMQLTYTLHINGNSVPGAKGSVFLFLQKPGAGGGGSGRAGATGPAGAAGAAGPTGPAGTPGAGVTTMSTAAGAPSGSCPAPSTMNLSLYTDTTSLDLWACVATDTFKKILSTTGTGAFTVVGAEGAAPGTPAAGNGICYFDSTSHAWTCKDPSGNVYAAVKNRTCTSGDFVSAVIAGVVTCSTPASGGASSYHVSNITVTSAQLKLMNTNGLELIPALSIGANNYARILSVTATMAVGSLAYTGGSELNFKVGGYFGASQSVPGSTIDFALINDAGGAGVFKSESINMAASTGVGVTATYFANQPVWITTSANFAAGNGTLLLSIAWVLMPTA